MVFDRIKNIVKAERADRKAKKEGEKEYDEDYSSLYYDEEYENLDFQSTKSTMRPTNFVPVPPQKEAEYYAALEVSAGSSFEEIKKSYRKIMKVYHPDNFVNDKAKYAIALQVTSQVNEAYAYFERKFGM